MTEKTRFRIEGMDCAACAAKIEKATRQMPGISGVSVSATAGTMIVEHDSSADMDGLAHTVARLGYRVAGFAPTGRQAQAQPGDKARLSDQASHHDCERDHHGHEHAAPGSQAGHMQADRPVEPMGLHGHDHGVSDGPWWSGSKSKLTIACGAALGAAMLLAWAWPETTPWSYVASMAIGLFPIARRAFAAARVGMPFTIETLVTVASVGAVAIGASEEAAVVVFLFLVGELLEGVAAGRARSSIKALATLVPKVALAEVDGRIEEVPAGTLEIGSVILVRPGDRIPADGTVLSGEGAVDEAPVTGESMPKRKQPDDAVYAGTINQEGVLRIVVAAAAQDNTIARIVRLVEEAQETKAPTERFIDSFSRYYTPGVLVVAALVAAVPPLVLGGVWQEWIYKGLAVLLIGCPCALVISTPAAIAAALSAGARRGMLMKGGAVLEALGKVTAVAFDKTGTLTAGKPVVTDLWGEGRSGEDTLRLAAALEAGSSHPLATAVLDAAKQRGVEIRAAGNARAIAGEGVAGEAGGAELFFGSPQAAARHADVPQELATRIAALNDEGKTVSVLVVDGAVGGIVAIRDEPREDARRGVAALKGLGISSVMLTGDNRRTAAAIGSDLGMEVRAELLPQDKQRIVAEMRRAGENVAKVGDGINDAPALAAADVGIAMGGGTDVALETADAAVLHGRVLDVAGMVELSRAAAANIRQNIAIALGLKVVFLVTTVIGITGLWPAILADTGATVLVTGNAMRLLGWRGRRT